jgi:tRNA-uridine 2-sulfurtransferase
VFIRCKPDYTSSFKTPITSELFKIVMVSVKEKVLVGMSGGVDSSVAAALLVEQGYEVIGVTIKTYRYEDVGGNIGNESSCCSLDGINDARLVCDMLGIPHYVVDFSEPFGKKVIDYFIDEYLSGRTPNPCVICNRTIKWEEMLVKADLIGAQYVATGHFARVRQDTSTGRFVISRGKDGNKDQSYAMWTLTQESLGRTIFPLGELTKPEVRELAGKYGLRTAAKGESYEICFIPDNDYSRFLKNNVDGLEEQVSDGNIMMNGTVIGKHRGFPFYTIGQRKGLGLATPEPVYVTRIDYKNNVIEVGRDEELMHTSCIAENLNLIKYPDLANGREVVTKVRYKDSGAPATVKDNGDGTIRVDFNEPRRAITPGQSVVFYEDDDLVGGAIISRVLEN